MLKGACINPYIMDVLARCGHGDRILITDANYPLETRVAENAQKVYVGLTSGVPDACQVLDVLAKEIPIERAVVMTPGTDKPEPEVFADFRKLLPGIGLETLGRFDFYEECMDSMVRLGILTGEKRTFSNILITVGVV